MRNTKGKRAGTETQGARVAAPQSEGQRRLREVVAAEGYPAISAQLGANKGTVHRWVSGERQPSAEVRARIEETLGIPVASWGQAARSAPAMAPVAQATAIARAARESAGDEFEELLEQMRGIDLEGLLATDAARILKMQWDMLESAEKRRRAREDQLAGHPSFRRTVEALLSALRPYPEALEAARDALQESLGS